jgi:hypothetical protein
MAVVTCWALAYVSLLPQCLKSRLDWRCPYLVMLYCSVYIPLKAAHTSQASVSKFTNIVPIGGPGEQSSFVVPHTNLKPSWIPQL